MQTKKMKFSDLPKVIQLAPRRDGIWTWVLPLKPMLVITELHSLSQMDPYTCHKPGPRTLVLSISGSDNDKLVTFPFPSGGRGSTQLKADSIQYTFRRKKKFYVFLELVPWEILILPMLWAQTHLIQKPA